ncbi:MAG: ABC transporter permease [Defluviitaleaceae bacterium]|nr:ABC transporter permease [Defluviitaleaceae bacterium]
MWKMILRRVLILIPQLFALSIIIFVMAHFMPGDALTGLIDPTISPEDIEIMREQLGLNRPLYVRYFDWVTSMLQGDFGRSFHHQRPVVDVIGERLPNTVRLSLVATIFTYLIAIPMGVIAGRYREKIADRAIINYTFFAIAIPLIVFALLNVYLFGFTLRWFPIQGSVDPRLATGTFAYHISRLQHLILPALTMALLGTAGIVNILRSEIIDNENSDYVTTVRAKGAPRRIVYNRHIFRNASLPLVAGFGFALVNLLSGTAVIERIFSFPGMGNLFVQSINGRDFSTANTLIMMYGIIGVVGTMLSDIFMIVADPRIRVK